MEVCSGHSNISHEEICYENRNCPLCEALKEIKSLEADIERLNNQE